MNNNEPINIDLRSDEMHEILSHRPHWAISWGMTLICITLAATVSVAFYIPYPDIVSTRVVLHTQTLPTTIAAPLNEKIAQLWAKQGDCVAANDLLAVLHSTTNFTAWQNLQQKLKVLSRLSPQIAILRQDLLSNIPHLGSLQNVYSDLQRYAQQYQNNTNMPFVQQRTDAIASEIKEYERLQNELIKQQNLLMEEINLQQKNLTRYEMLHNDGKTVALAEVEKEKMRLLQLQRDLENSRYQQQQYNTQLAALKSQIVQQQTQNSEQHNWHCLPSGKRH